MVNVQLLNYGDAKAFCTQHNAYLTDIQSAAENEFLRMLIMSALHYDSNVNDYAKGAWIGYNDIGSEGAFVWGHTGLTGTYTNWANNEPNDCYNGCSTEDCVSMFQFQSGSWNDYDCGQLKASVCKKGRPV